MSRLTSSVASAIKAHVYQPRLYEVPSLNLAALAVRLHPRHNSWTLEDEACEHYVYVFLDPRKPGSYVYTLPSGKVIRFKYQPYYVGKGKDKRVAAHFKLDALRKKHHKNHTILAIKRAGFEPQNYIEITKTRRTDCMAQALEIDMIAGIGRSDLKQGPLTNLTDGGEGASGNKGGVGRILSKESRAKIGDAHRGRKLTEAHIDKIRAGYRLSDAGRQSLSKAASTKKWTTEMRNRVSAGLKGHVISPETREKIGAAHRGRKLSEAHREKLRTCVRIISDTAREKMGEASRRPRSEATKAKMKAAALLREAAKRAQRV